MTCSIAFLTVAMGINPGAPDWNILEWFQNNTVSEMLKWFVLELFLNNIFMEQFLEKSLMLLESF